MNTSHLWFYITAIIVFIPVYTSCQISPASANGHVFQCDLRGVWKRKVQMLKLMSIWMHSQLFRAAWAFHTADTPKPEEKLTLYSGQNTKAKEIHYTASKKKKPSCTIIECFILKGANTAFNHTALDKYSPPTHSITFQAQSSVTTWN